MEFDVLIRHGTVVDGSGREPAYLADVGIVGDRIEAVGGLEGANGSTIIEATGRVVAPGFIDVHVHSELNLLEGELRYGSVLQGVTTHLTGPDGFGWGPLSLDLAGELWEETIFAYGHVDFPVGWPSPEAYLSLFPGRSPVNVVPQAPHCAIRLVAMGWEPRPASPEELERMKTVLEQWLEAGAVSLSVGLDYQPSAFSDTRELVELSKVVLKRGGIYNAHIRNNDLGREGAWRETMEIGQRSGVPVHVAHEYVSVPTERLLAEAPSVCDLTFELYMYPAGCTHLAFSVPNWAQAGGPREMLRRLKDPAQRQRIRDHLEQRLGDTHRQGGKQVIAANQTGRHIGRSLAEAAAIEGLSIGEFATRALEEEHPFALTINHRPGTPEEHQEMVRKTISHPRMMVASDGMYFGTFAHPRAFGCFARAIRLGVRELGAVGLEEVVYKMSGFPAERFRIEGRGLLKPGYGADVVIFDPERIADRATWEEPRLEPVGIDRVLVNGETVVHDGKPTGVTPGQVARRRD